MIPGVQDFITRQQQQQQQQQQQEEAIELLGKALISPEELRQQLMVSKACVGGCVEAAGAVVPFLVKEDLVCWLSFCKELCVLPFHAATPCALCINAA